MSDIDDLIARLRGTYRLPVNDGAGPLNGSTEFVHQFQPTPIMLEAAGALIAWEARIAELEHSLREAADALAAQQARIAELENIGSVLSLPEQYASALAQARKSALEEAAQWTAEATRELEADIRWLVVKLGEGQDGWWMPHLDRIIAQLAIAAAIRALMEKTG